MARSIDEYQDRSDGISIAEYADRGTTRSTARAFAAAISALAISALVITSSSDALNDEGTFVDNQISAGSITLADDDEGRSLFSLDNLGPNDIRTECIQILYTGSILPVDLTMAANVGGTGLARYLDIKIEAGSTGKFDDCGSFVETGPVFEGTLQELGDRGPIELLRFLNVDDKITYRFTVEMDDTQEAVEKTATVGFTWQAAASL